MYPGKAGDAAKTSTKGQWEDNEGTHGLESTAQHVVIYKDNNLGTSLFDTKEWLCTLLSVSVVETTFFPRSSYIYCISERCKPAVTHVFLRTPIENRTFLNLPLPIPPRSLAIPLHNNCHLIFPITKVMVSVSMRFHHETSNAKPAGVTVQRVVLTFHSSCHPITKI